MASLTPKAAAAVRAGSRQFPVRRRIPKGLLAPFALIHRRLRVSAQADCADSELSRAERQPAAPSSSYQACRQEYRPLFLREPGPEPAEPPRSVRDGSA